MKMCPSIASHREQRESDAASVKVKNGDKVKLSICASDDTHDARGIAHWKHRRRGDPHHCALPSSASSAAAPRRAAEPPLPPSPSSASSSPHAASIAPPAAAALFAVAAEPPPPPPNPPPAPFSSSRFAPSRHRDSLVVTLWRRLTMPRRRLSAAASRNTGYKEACKIVSFVTQTPPLSVRPPQDGQSRSTPTCTDGSRAAY